MSQRSGSQSFFKLANFTTPTHSEASTPSSSQFSVHTDFVSGRKPRTHSKQPWEASMSSFSSISPALSPEIGSFEAQYSHLPTLTSSAHLTSQTSSNFIPPEDSSSLEPRNDFDYMPGLSSFDNKPYDDPQDDLMPPPQILSPTSRQSPLSISTSQHIKTSSSCLLSPVEITSEPLQSFLGKENTANVTSSPEIPRNYSQYASRSQRIQSVLQTLQK
ncbi:hypothetical protein H0H92_010075 [Tricholoma furcatifolium]|nr:hypothetical protein H0H92_010075 [Tricholoma furcatifolium]